MMQSSRGGCVLVWPGAGYTLRACWAMVIDSVLRKEWSVAVF